MHPDITDLLTRAVKTALEAAGLPVPADVMWEVPREEHHGDYASNVAMTLARSARQSPRKIAESIVRSFPRVDLVERIEIAGPGFLNVFLSPSWCARALAAVLDVGDGYGGGEAGKGQRYLLEFVSANPTGPLVIVNARAAAVGDALARILRFRGDEVHQAVADQDEEVRMWSALALVNSQEYDKRTVPILVQVLKNENSVLRQVACLSLGLVP